MAAVFLPLFAKRHDMKAIATMAPISANHPDPTALWASLSRIVNHLIHRIHVRMRADMIQGLSAPNPCYLAKGGEK